MSVLNVSNCKRRQIRPFTEFDLFLVAGDCMKAASFIKINASIANNDNFSRQTTTTTKNIETVEMNFN